MQTNLPPSLVFFTSEIKVLIDFDLLVENINKGERAHVAPQPAHWHL